MQLKKVVNHGNVRWRVSSYLEGKRSQRFFPSKRRALDWMSNSRNMIEGTDEITDLLRKHGGKTGEELKAEGK